MIFQMKLPVWGLTDLGGKKKYQCASTENLI